jgi:hypothetical protein
VGAPLPVTGPPPFSWPPLPEGPPVGALPEVSDGLKLATVPRDESGWAD